MQQEVLDVVEELNPERDRPPSAIGFTPVNPGRNSQRPASITSA